MLIHGRGKSERTKLVTTAADGAVLRRIAAIALVAVVVSCRAGGSAPIGGPSDDPSQSPVEQTSVPSQSPVELTSVPSQAAASATADSSDTALQSPSVDDAVAAILVDPNAHLDLQPIPEDAPPALVDGEQASAIVLSYLNLDGQPVVYLEHGVGYVSEDTPSATLWLVIAKVPDMQPFAVGPLCPDKPDQTCAWAVNDYGVALVSDQSGAVLRSLTTMREVPDPNTPWGPISPRSVDPSQAKGAIAHSIKFRSSLLSDGDVD